MPVMPPTFRPAGAADPVERKRKFDQQRGSASERGYGSRWVKARLTYLAREPLCRMCAAQGRVVAANVVDHIVPHRGDQALFWSTDNWQALCKPCHDRDKQRLDRAAR